MHLEAKKESKFSDFCWAGEIWRVVVVGVVNFVVLARVLRSTTKKGRQLFKEKVHPKENSGDAPMPTCHKCVRKWKFQTNFPFAHTYYDSGNFYEREWEFLLKI